jgi:hypothetical protein
MADRRVVLDLTEDEAVTLDNMLYELLQARGWAWGPEERDLYRYLTEQLN